MEAKDIRDEILISAIVKVAVYACYDGYFPDEKGVEKKYDIEDVLSMEEMIAVKPYINAIKEKVLGFPSYNEKPKINGR